MQIKALKHLLKTYNLRLQHDEGNLLYFKVYDIRGRLLISEDTYNGLIEQVKLLV